MPEFEVSLPTNLLDKRSLTLKINMGFSQERRQFTVSDDILITDEQDNLVQQRSVVLESDISNKVSLKQLQMYLKYCPDMSRMASKPKRKDFSDKTFKREDIMPTLPLFQQSDGARPPSSLKSQIIFPFDFTLTADSRTVTKDKVERDLSSHSQLSSLDIMRNMSSLVNKSAGAVGKSKTDIRVLNDFKLQLRLVEVAKYQQII